MTNYQQAKEQLKESAKWIKRETPNDKPMIRMYINDMCGIYCNDYDLTDYQRDLLSNYACKLHPKN